MTKPIEIIHQNFETKVETVQKIFDILDIDISDKKQKFTDIKNDYNDQTLTVLCEYFSSDDMKKKCKAVDKYMQVILSCNYLTHLGQIVQSLQDIIDKNKIDSLELQLLMKKYHTTPIDTQVHRFDYKICPSCNSKMILFPHTIELRCQKCNYIMILKGTAFDETHLYTNDGNMTKRGAYETSRHCRYHLERILAIKNPNINERVWEKIHLWLKRNNFQYLKLVTCPDYRRCLKEIKETKYNEHVPFIRQVISGVSPERLFHHEIRSLYMYFEKAVSAFNKLKDGERANLKYYPYFIFKIIEMILSKPDDKKRLQSIVDCIHFQRDNTIVANDRLWAEICEEVPEFVFKKTDKNLLYSV